MDFSKLKIGRNSFSVDCDTTNSKFWVHFAAVNRFPRRVFEKVTVVETDTSYIYSFSSSLPKMEYGIRDGISYGYFVVRKGDCKLIKSVLRTR